MWLSFPTYKPGLTLKPLDTVRMGPRMQPRNGNRQEQISQKLTMQPVHAAFRLCWLYCLLSPLSPPILDCGGSQDVTNLLHFQARRT